MWFIEALVNTPGVGGAIACAAIGAVVICYGMTIRWISRGCNGKTDRQ